jgi:hypothetical protein
MPLSTPISPRALKHKRAIQIEAYARDDGLWDIEARIEDTKTREIKLQSGARPPGAALHDMSLRVTIDTRFQIVEVDAVSDAVPYPGDCDTIGPAYQQLIGLNLVKGFRRSLIERMGGIRGCTHMTELALVLPTAAIQAFAGEVFSTQQGKPGDRQDQKPFQLDNCHALRTDGAVVAKYYPRWAITPEPS